MQNLLNDLIALLEKDARLVFEGHLLKNKIVEMALGMDAGLIKLLMTHEDIRRHFFIDADGVAVFDKVRFQQFVMNKQFLPDSYTAYKNKVGLTVNGQYLTDSKEVVLAWPYKDCVLEGGQDKEDAKRDEVFWNETLAPDQIDRLLAPKVLTGFKKYDKDGEHKVTEISRNDNLIIKGNNLLALYTLKTAYAGKVKLIYIDPPYNTDRDSFLYNDSFKASTWLTFMRNRINIAKRLLSEDGVFIVQLSDHRVAETKLLLDDVLGRENFVNHITVKTRSPSGFKTVNLGTFEAAEYLFIYAKNKSNVSYSTQYVASEYDNNYKYVVKNIEKAPASWELDQVANMVSLELGYKNANEAKKKLGKDAFHLKSAEYALLNRNIVFRYTEINNDASKEAVALRDKSKKDEKIYEFDGVNGKIFVHKGKQIAFYSKKVREIDGKQTPTMILSNIWTDIPWEGIANEGGVKLKEGKKPEKLIRRLLDMYTETGDIILDYHIGSGTTCAVAHKMDRRYIGIEQLDYGNNDSVIRLKNVINGDQSGVSKLVNWQRGGSFVYCELSKSNQTFFDKIESAKATKDLQKIWSDMQERAFLSYRVDPKTIDPNSKDFESLSLDDQKRFLIEVLDKNMLYVPYSEIDDKTYGISEDDKKLNRQFYEGTGE